MFFHFRPFGLIASASALVSFLFSGCSGNRKNFVEPHAEPEKITSSPLTVLDNQERHDGFLFHAGYLWVGHSTNGNYVEIFSPDGRSSSKLQLPHGANEINPFTENSVLIVGAFNKNDNLHSAYSIASVSPQGPKIQAITSELSPELYITNFTGSPENMIFSDPGLGALISYKPWKATKPNESAPEYNPHDDEEETDIQKILDIEAPGSKALNVSARGNFNDSVVETGKRDPQQLSGPGKMVTKGERVFVIEKAGPEATDDRMAWLDPTDGIVHHFFDLHRKGLTDVTALDENYSWIVATEFYRKQLLFIDAKTGSWDRSVPVETFPTAVRQLGHCLVVLGQDKKLIFLDLEKNGEPVDAWNVGQYGFFLDFPRNLELDPISKTVFVGSRRNCRYCEAQSNGIIRIEQPSHSTFDYCLHR